MYWDLEEEHKAAYDENECAEIDDLTNLFDIILDYMHEGNGLYPWTMCVDVFFCDNQKPESTIPKFIQQYYCAYLKEDEKKKVQEMYDPPFDLEDGGAGKIEDVLRDAFHMVHISERWTGTLKQHQENIRIVATKLQEKIGLNCGVKYKLTKKDLECLATVYLGILIEGYIIQCGKYAFLVLTGSSE